jgi:hypothetical protein
MAATAASTRTRGTAGRTRTRAAASGTLVSSALEAANGHHFTDVRRFAFGTTDGFVAPKDKPFELFAAVAACIFIYWHFNLQDEI